MVGVDGTEATSNIIIGGMESFVVSNKHDAQLADVFAIGEARAVCMCVCVCVCTCVFGAVELVRRRACCARAVKPLRSSHHAPRARVGQHDCGVSARTSTRARAASVVMRVAYV